MAMQLAPGLLVVGGRVATCAFPSRLRSPSPPALYTGRAQCVPIRTPNLSRSDSSPVLDFLFLAPKLFNFELELYRAAFVACLDRFFLFYVSFDEQVLDINYSVSFSQNSILSLVHCQAPSK